MNYYFPAKFDYNNPYFNKVKLTSELKDQVGEDVCDWIEANLDQETLDSPFLEYVLKNTISKIDVNYDQGCFYYHWLNEFVRDAALVVFHSEMNAGKVNGLNEKTREKNANAKVSEFEKWLKVNFK